ncbi:MAG: hypothetical protein M3333_04875 [Actinomycetota bacterium]|nr:hypothetical protein [Actinomycetota bacterium]
MNGRGRGGAAVLLVLIGVGLLGAVLIGMVRPAEPSPVAAIELRSKRSAGPADRPSVGVISRRLESVTEARRENRERIGGADDAGSGVEEDDPEKGEDDSGGDDPSSRDEDRGRKGVDEADDDGSGGEDDLNDDGYVGEDDDGEGHETDVAGSAGGDDDDREGADDADDGGDDDDGEGADDADDGEDDD